MHRIRSHSGTKQQATSFLQNGQPLAAYELLKPLCDAGKADADCWFMLGATCGQLGKLPEAEQCARKVLKLAPGTFTAWDNLGLSLMLQGKQSEAEKCFRKCIRMQPDHTPAHNHLGHLYCQIGRMEDSIHCLKKAIRQNPQYAEAHNNLATTLIKMGEFPEAEEHSRLAIRVNPGYAEAYSNLGIALHSQGEMQAALDSYQQALKLSPHLAETHLSMGKLLEELNRLDDAIICFRHALELKPDMVAALVALGVRLAAQQKTDQARKYLEHARDLSPENPGVATELSALSALSGDYEKAFEEINPSPNSICNTLTAVAFANISGELGRDAQAMKYMERVEKSIPQSRLRENEAFHFAKARLCERLGKFDLAFTHYQAANQGIQHPNDLNKHIQEMDQLEACFTREHLATLPASGLDTEKPVFIVGMPRSGTTLVEQILASHSRIHGGGELTNLWTLLKSLGPENSPSVDYSHIPNNLTTSVCNEKAQWYLDQLTHLSAVASRVTDKLPHNFLHLGMIQLLFPRASIIHCTRNPVDTCFSIYCQKFNINHQYARDLSELGRYYVRYQRLMQHWHNTLSLPILEVSYEALVQDTETVSRAMVKHCGLQWEDDCLRFFESSRIAYTPSNQQVRRPIYRQAIDKWKHYENHLGPLLEALTPIMVNEKD